MGIRKNKQNKSVKNHLIPTKGRADLQKARGSAKSM